MDVVIYVGLFVNLELLEYCKLDCEIYNSVSMNLIEIIDCMEVGVIVGKEVVCL